MMFNRAKRVEFYVAAALASMTLAGCGDLASSDAPLCGPNTVEQDGKCVPTDDVYACGEGTTLEEGVCVIDPSAPQPEVKPFIEEVNLLGLRVNSDEKLYVQHDLPVSLEVEVTGHPMRTSLVVGLVAPGGTQGCLLGGLSLEHDGGEEPQIHELAHTFHIPTSCEPLLNGDAELFVSYDPWHETAVDGRQDITGDEPTDGVEEAETFIEFALHSRMELDEACADCVSTVALEPNPGRDVELLEFNTHSSVLVLPVASRESQGATADELVDVHAQAGLPMPVTKGEVVWNDLSNLTGGVTAWPFSIDLPTPVPTTIELSRSNSFSISPFDAPAAANDASFQGAQPPYDTVDFGWAGNFTYININSEWPQPNSGTVSLDFGQPATANGEGWQYIIGITALGYGGQGPMDIQSSQPLTRVGDLPVWGNDQYTTYDPNTQTLMGPAGGANTAMEFFVLPQDASSLDLVLEDLGNSNQPDTFGIWFGAVNALVEDQQFVDVEPEQAELHETPTLMAAASYRVVGEDPQAQVIGEDTVHLAFRVRPVAGTPEAEALAPEDREWMPLKVEEHIDAGEGELVEDHQAESHLESLKGFDTHHSFVAVDVVHETRDKMVSGSWAGIEEFEIEACVEASFIEAEYEEGDSATNHCATLQILVLRQEHTPHGVVSDRTVENHAENFGKKHLWRKDWSTSEAGLELKSWYEVGSTKNPNGTPFGEIGDRMYGPGSWYEAGARATLSLFGANLVLAKAEGQMRDYEASSPFVDFGKIEIRAFIWTMIPYSEVPLPDGTLTLQDFLNLQRAKTGKEYPTEKTFEKAVVGKNFDVPCGGAKASISVFLTLGLDQGATSITKSEIPRRPGTCTAGEPRSADGKYCYANHSDGKFYSVSQANEYCKANFPGGRIAAPTSHADFNAVRQATGPNAWFLTNTIFKRVPAGFQLERYDHTVAGTPWAPALAPGQDINSFAGTAVGDYLALHINPSNQSVLAASSSGAANVVCQIPVRGETSNGSKLTVDIVPHIAAGAKAELSVDFSFITFGIALTVNVLDFAVHFVGSVGAYVHQSGALGVELGRRIYAQLSALSGSLDVWIDWEAGFWIFKKSGRHEKTIFSWDGFVLGTWDILPEETYDLTLF